MEKIYVLIRWNTDDDSDTILKAYADEKTAKAEMENLEKTKGRKSFNYFVTEVKLVGG